MTPERLPVGVFQAAAGWFRRGLERAAPMAIGRDAASRESTSFGVVRTSLLEQVTDDYELVALGLVKTERLAGREPARLVIGRLWERVVAPTMQGVADGRPLGIPGEDELRWLVEPDPSIAADLEFLTETCFDPNANAMERLGAQVVVSLAHLVRSGIEPVRYGGEREIGQRLRKLAWAERPLAVPDDNLNELQRSMLLSVQSDIVTAALENEREIDDDERTLLLLGANSLPPFRGDQIMACLRLADISWSATQADPLNDRLVDRTIQAARWVVASARGPLAIAGAELLTYGLEHSARYLRQTERLLDGCDLLEDLLVSSDPEARAGLHLSVAVLLNHFLEVNGHDEAVFDRASIHAQQAVHSSTNDDEVTFAKSILASFQHRQALISPGLVDLDEPIRTLRSVLEEEGLSGVVRVQALGNLAFMLQSRFVAWPNEADVDEILELTDEALGIDLTLAEAATEARASCYVNRSVALARRLEMFGDESDHTLLGETLAKAHAEVGPEHPIRFKLDLVRAFHLARDHRMNPVPDTIDDALAVLTDVIEGGNSNDPRVKALFWSSMCEILRLKAVLIREENPDSELGDDLLVEAAAAGRRALESLTFGDPERPAAAFNLAVALAFSNEPAGIDEAVEVLASILDNTYEAPVVIKLKAAFLAMMIDSLTSTESVVDDLHHRWTDLLNELAFEGLERRSQERLLAGWVDGGDLAVRQLSQDEAALVLERSRTILWNRQEATREILQDLAEVPEVAEQLDEIRRHLGRGHRDDRLVAARRLDEVAQTYGHHRPAISIDALAGGLGSEVVCYLAVGEGVVRALFVTSDGAEAVGTMPEVDTDELTARSNNYFAALEDLQRDSGAGGEGLRDVLADLLPWLWDEFMGKIVAVHDAIDSPWFSAEDSLRRSALLNQVVWCPSGPLSNLPLHAAGHYTPDGPVPGQNLMERTISSYTTSLRSLVANGTRPLALGGNSRLAVRCNWGPEAVPAEFIIARDEEGSLTKLELGEATVERVLRELGRHDLVHFACHGTQDVNDPSNARLVLHDGDLTMDYMSGLAGDRELAVLLACSTALSGPGLPAEGLAMTGAFQHAGWRRVVGTLWPIRFDPTDAFYAYLFQDSGSDQVQGPVARSSAEAVRAAALEQARRFGFDQMDHWANLVHLGPAR